MFVTIEKIEELKKRSKISYEEAKILLEKHNGNVVEALIELEKNKKISESCSRGKESYEGMSKIKKLFNRGNCIRLIITRKNETIANVPLNYLILAMILGFHLMVLSLIIVFITGCKMSIKKGEGELVDVDDAIIDAAHKVRTSAESFAEDFNTNTNKNEGQKKEGIDLSKEKKDYNEHTVG
jgi:hypothetical protein